MIPRITNDLMIEAKRNPDARNKVLMNAKPIALWIYSRSGPRIRSKMEPGDMIGTACIALCHAINTWNPERGIKASTYAIRSVEHNIRRDYAQHYARPFRVPDWPFLSIVPRIGGVRPSMAAPDSGLDRALAARDAERVLSGFTERERDVALAWARLRGGSRTEGLSAADVASKWGFSRQYGDYLTMRITPRMMRLGVRMRREELGYGPRWYAANRERMASMTRTGRADRASTENRRNQ